MTLLTTFQLVELGEKSDTMAPVLWSFDYLVAAHPELSVEDIMGLPVGSHSALMMQTRASNFGPAITSINPCSHCDESVEINSTAEKIGLGAQTLELTPAASVTAAVTIADKNYTVRALSSADLLEAQKQRNIDYTKQMLISRVAPDAVVESPEHQQAVEQALEQLDPGADIWLTFGCPSCGTQQSIAFEPVQYVMHELRRYARQVLREVAMLAQAYHWSERDIMAMPSSRRYFYLQEAGL